MPPEPLFSRSRIHSSIGGPTGPTKSGWGRQSASSSTCVGRARSIVPTLFCRLAGYLAEQDFPFHLTVFRGVDPLVGGHDQVAHELFRLVVDSRQI